MGITNHQELEDETQQARKMETLGSLASGVAHDFNNVLQVILGCVTVARSEGQASERADRFLERAANAAKRGGQLANQLMDFSRKQKDAPRPIAVDPVIDSLAPFVQRLLTEKVTLQIELGAPCQTIVADPIQIEQILFNLAANARDAMPDGGVLSIRTDTIEKRSSTALHGALNSKTKTHYVRVLVQDSGIGMDEATRDHVFEPFFTTKAVGKGTGLGLATVFNIVQRLNGCIDLRSQPGEGTTFILDFPCCEQQPEKLPPLSRPPKKLSGTVLLVEDEPLVRSTVRHYLEAIGCDVLEADGAEQAQQVSARHPRTLDVLISDVVMPVMQGPQLADVLKRRFPRLRVLLMSGDPGFLGATTDASPRLPVLRKPFNQEDLACRLHELFVAEDSNTASEQACVGATASGADATTRTILLVEHETSARMALAELLINEGYHVLSAPTPSEAIEAAARHEGTVHLLLADVRLGEMNGGELAARLRSRWAELRVVFMSGRPRPSDTDVVFLQKPLDFDALVATIETVLSS